MELFLVWHSRLRALTKNIYPALYTAALLSPHSVSLSVSVSPFLCAACDILCCKILLNNLWRGNISGLWHPRQSRPIIALQLTDRGKAHQNSRGGRTVRQFIHRPSGTGLTVWGYKNTESDPKSKTCVPERYHNHQQPGTEHQAPASSARPLSRHGPRYQSRELDLYKDINCT